MSRLLFACLVAAAALAGCYKTPTPECAFACEVGGDETCPDGYTCRADGFCKRDGVADGFACPDTVDASSPDTPVTDAAGIDMATDAAVIDAPTDAATDAAVIDAAVDAPDIDAPTDAPTDAPVDAEVDA